MSDRHEKWVPVGDGCVIPEGQPYAVQYAHGSPYWAEFIAKKDVKVWQSGQIEAWFVDSSWRPPLDLPTECGWYLVELRRRDGESTKWRPLHGHRSGEFFAGERVDRVVQVIPLTDEQVARIEAAR